MSELQVFSNAEFGPVRSITVNGEPYFVGKDVAEILGYANTRDALAKHVDEEDRMDGVAIRDSIGREQTPVLINESGLYSLILSSRLPSAKRFKRWVTSEVLPAIRRHGVFLMDDIVNNTDALIEALQAFKAERIKRMALEQEAAVQKQQLAEMRPKASYYDVVLNSPSLLAVSEFAKDYGWSAKRMNQYLHEKGVQYKQGGKIWLLYQKYAGCGYTSTKTHAYPAHDGTTHTKVHTYWTQKGRLFIYDLMKADGILPLIERGELSMGISKYNSEGYYDPVVYEALTRIEAEERAARAAAAYRPLVYICSPYAGNVEKNTFRARAFSRFAVERHCIPIAPHLLCPQYLDEETERWLGLKMGIVFMGKCEEVWVFGDTVSEGMAAEIEKARKLRKKIRYFTDDLREKEGMAG